MLLPRALAGRWHVSLSLPARGQSQTFATRGGQGARNQQTRLRASKLDVEVKVVKQSARVFWLAL